MKLIFCSLFAAFTLTLQPNVFAQCTTANLNWDALDYIPTTGYSNATATALSPNQYFALGKNRLNITYASCTSSGENAAHTGSTGSYGTGDDVQFTGNGTVTISFATAVTNLKFSVYDIDKGQVMAVAATNSGVSTAVNMVKANSGSSDITIAANTVTSVSGNQSEGTNTTTVNIDVAGPVTSVTLTISNSNSRNGGQADSDFWLSDISACVTGSFPTSYYAVSRPFTGMPGYVLVAANKSVYMADPATGNAKFIFSDGATSGTVNSLAYDPYNRVIYYCWSLTNNGAANASERTLRKYSFATGTSTTVLNDITSLGVPTFDQGVESGAAAFYDGALYIGIEGGADNSGGGPKVNTNKESIIWRIDFNGSGVPVTATQVFAVSGDVHDWSDFSINDGILYDFNGDAGNEDYHHFNMQTGVNTQVPYVTTAPKQSAVGWNGTVYWINNRIASYNLNGSIGTQYSLTASPAIPNFGTSSSPSFGDGGEAYRPLVDFGDAPSSYDPDPLAPALHEISASLKLGGTTDVEWDKTSSVNANADGGDEDGLPFVQILSNNGNYYTDLDVYNNTGADATVCAWVDFNGNGAFEAGEGISQTVATGTATQRIQLYWPAVVTSLADNSYTYIRIRITSASNNMTTANATGYFANGEVEDYYVVVSMTPLDVRLTQFSAVKMNEQKAGLEWMAEEEEKGTVYEVQRSGNGAAWQTIAQQTATEAGSVSYHYTDESPEKPASCYRLKYTDVRGQTHYSKVQKIQFSIMLSCKVYPNPASSNSVLKIEATDQDWARLQLTDISGKTVHEQMIRLKKGTNTIALPVVNNLRNGIYSLRLFLSRDSFTQKLIVHKN